MGSVMSKQKSLFRYVSSSSNATGVKLKVNRLGGAWRERERGVSVHAQAIQIQQARPLAGVGSATDDVQFPATPNFS